jgi:hypothetical protein
LKASQNEKLISESENHDLQPPRDENKLNQIYQLTNEINSALEGNIQEDEEFECDDFNPIKKICLQYQNFNFPQFTEKDSTQ